MNSKIVHYVRVTSETNLAYSLDDIEMQQKNLKERITQSLRKRKAINNNLNGRYADSTINNPRSKS